MSAGLRFERVVEDLKNGLRVILVRRPHLPIQSLAVLVRAGVVSEGSEEAGLAGFTAGLLPRGTERRDALSLAEDVDGLGASLGTHSDYDYSMAGISSLARHQKEAMGILAEILTLPAFRADEVERRRSDLLSVLERQRDNPNDRVRNRFIERIYGTHPYHHPAEGTPDSVGRLDGNTSRRFYERFYRPNNAILAGVGDFDVPNLLRSLEDAFSGWISAPVAEPELPPIPIPQSPVVEKIQKDGMTQATLRIGSIGIRRDSPDYVPLVLLNYILGGSGFGSRLMKSLREEQGLTYGVHSNFHPRREQGYFFASCQTGLATMNQALAGMFAETSRLRDQGITAGELEWAQRFFSGSLPLSLQTNDQLATRVLEQEFYGLEDEFWLKDIERMRTTSVEEVNEVARRYLHPETFTIVALADFRQAELVVPGAA